MCSRHDNLHFTHPPNLPDGVKRGGPPPPEMATFEVEYTQTYTFTMQAPRDITREELWEQAEEEYADVTGAILEDHEILSVVKR